MSFDISLRGPKRSFTVESFILSGEVLDRTIARFQVGSGVKIVDEEIATIPDSPKGIIPRLQVPNIAGLEQVIGELNKFLATSHVDQLSWPSLVMRELGVLLHGGHGTGKTLVLRKLSETGWGKVFYIDAQMKPSAIRDIFKEARQTQRGIIVIDDIDLLFSKEQGRSLENEKVLGEEMDRLTVTSLSDGKATSKVVVAAATSSPNEVPRSMRKYGRFTTEIIISVPDANARKRILRSLAPTTSTNSQIELIDRLGDRTHAYTGEDLVLLLMKTYKLAVQRHQQAQYDGTYTDAMLQMDIDEALRAVRPSAMHDITLKPPKVRWHEIGGQENIKKALRRALETPLKVRCPVPYSSMTI
jgi:AAA family ATPase